jgi:polyphosphate glucokinase
MNTDNRQTRSKHRVLVIDIGGSHVKLKGPNGELLKIDSGRKLDPQEMVYQIKKATKGWEYDVVSIGYPGVVTKNAVAQEPANLGKGWVGFNFARAFGKQVAIVNDAGMQALGSTTKEGKTLFIGLGTGLGVAVVHAEKDGKGGLRKTLFSTELGHTPISKRRDFEDLVGKQALEGKDGRISKQDLKEWTKSLKVVVEKLSAFTGNPDHIVIGGGNVKLIADNFREVFPDKRIMPGRNDLAFAGGEDLWKQASAA